MKLKTLTEKEKDFKVKIYIDDRSNSGMQMKYFQKEDVKQFIKEILEEIERNIKDIELSLEIGENLKQQAGKNAFVDIEEKEKFTLVVLKDIKQIIKQKAGFEELK